MVPRVIRMLHVEDDPFQRKLMAHHLQQIHDFQFAITCAGSEEEAVAQFGRGLADFVIIDYHLSQGDGLNCLRRLRHQDPVVPIVAISGQATPEIAAQLLQSGADDYIGKRDLRSASLARSIHLALVRADAWRRQALLVDPSEDVVARFKTSLLHLGKCFLARLDPAFLNRLADCEAAALDGNLSAEEVQKTFAGVCTELAAARHADTANVSRLLRPLLLAIQASLGSVSNEIEPGRPPR